MKLRSGSTRKIRTFTTIIAQGIPFSDELRLEVFEKVFDDLEGLIEDHPHIVVDEALHKREIRHVLYDQARRMAGSFIVIWVKAREEIILKRLGAKKREGHILDDPLPLHNAIRRDFDDYNRCVIDCPNNGRAEDAVADLAHLIESIAALTEPQKA